MIGKEDPYNEEEQELKVTDKRKFNVDGSLREGVTIPKEEPKPAVEPVSEQIITDTALPENKSVIEGASEPAASVEIDSEEDMLDEKDPASFINFLSTLVTNAAASLGAMPHPVTGQKSVDLEAGKYWIDVLTMLKEKTEGNLSSRESSLMTSIVSDLKMQFVALNRATEEKLKAQAAQKFSSKDILGG